jgi:hypothetical protein
MLLFKFFKFPVNFLDKISTEGITVIVQKK